MSSRTLFPLFPLFPLDPPDAAGPCLPPLPPKPLRPRRRPRPRLFGRSGEVPPPGGRARWRPGETLAEYAARTDDRRVRREELPKDVRIVKGGAAQARPWVGPGQSDNVNLGLFHPEEYGNDRHAAISAAARASREFKKRLAGPPVRDVWEVIQELQRLTRFGLPVVPPHVLPPRVRRLPGGGFGVRGRSGVWATADEAWAAAKGGR